MNIFGVIAAFFLCAMSGSALAEDISVRSGEHANFSRLVLTFESPPDWQLGRDENGYILRFPNKDASFNLASIFDRMPKSRIENVAAQSAESLAISVACICYAKAFMFRPNVLVVDIITGDPPKTAAFEARLDGAAPDPPKIKSPSITLPLAGSLRVPEPSFDFSNRTLRSTTTIADAEVAVISAAHLARARSEVMQQIGRASTLGLLIPESTQSQKVPSSKPEAPNAIQHEEANSEGQPAPNLKAENSFDRNLPSSQANIAVTPAGGACIASNRLGVSDWGGANGQIADFSVLRRDLVGEFDRPSDIAISKLVKAYLHAGFGAEAIATLKAFNTSIPDDSILKDMGRILDDVPVPASSFGTQLACETSASFWAVLAHGHKRKGAKIAFKSALETFSSFPPHLRILLGPRLSERFTQAGNLAAATAVRNAIARSSEADTGALQLLEARLELARGQQQSAATTLTNLVEKDGPLAPDALVAIVKLRLDRGEEIDGTTLTSLSALAFEYRGTDVGRELAKVSVLARSRVRMFDIAMAELEYIQRDTSLDDSEKNMLLSQVISDVTDTASDAEFLRQVVLSKLILAKSNFPDTKRLAVAIRLTGIGAFSEAESLLHKGENTLPGDNLVLAEAALARSNPDSALNLIGDEASNAAKSLRADAFAAKKDYQSAFAELEFMAEDARKADFAWLSGRWADVERLGGPEQQAIALMMTSSKSSNRTEHPDSGEGTATLASARSQIEASKSVRDAVETLLKSMPIEPSGDL